MTSELLWCKMDKSTDDYYARLWKNLGNKLGPTELKRRDYILEAVQDHYADKPLEILDYSCGRGWLAPFLSRYGRVTGIDVTRDALKYAEKEYGAFAEFIYHPPEVPFHDVCGERYDIVVLTEVLEHTDKPSAIIADCAACAKKGAKLIITTPNAAVWGEFARQHSASLQPIENWISREGLRQLALQNNLFIARHGGIVDNNFRDGEKSRLQSRFSEFVFLSVGLRRIYTKITQERALYQTMICRKQ